MNKKSFSVGDLKRLELLPKVLWDLYPTFWAHAGVSTLMREGIDVPWDVIPRMTKREGTQLSTRTTKSGRRETLNALRVLYNRRAQQFCPRTLEDLSDEYVKESHEYLLLLASLYALLKGNVDALDIEVIRTLQEVSGFSAAKGNKRNYPQLKDYH